MEKKNFKELSCEERCSYYDEYFKDYNSSWNFKRWMIDMGHMDQSLDPFFGCEILCSDQQPDNVNIYV